MEESRYTLNGGLLILKPDTLAMVATDGHRLALAETDQKLDSACSACHCGPKLLLQVSVVPQLGANRKAAQPGAAFTEYAMLSGFGRIAGLDRR
jgi:DNA polymerase III beta subunit, central domain